jgi:hypothetical protein
MAKIFDENVWITLGGATRIIENDRRKDPTLKAWLVYLQLNKKKAKAEGKKCHAKTMWSQ